MSGSLYEKLNMLSGETGFDIICDNSPVIAAAADFPAQQFNSIRALPLSLTGKSSKEKINSIREEMRKHGALAHVISSLEEIAWIMNMRGTDIKNTPVFYAYMYLTSDNAYLFAHESAASDIHDELKAAEVNLLPYHDFYSFLTKRKENSLLCDKSQVNYAIISAFDSSVEITDKRDPGMLFKAIKNQTEVENLKRVHLYDGLALARFMHYIKTSDKTKLTEISASEILRSLREKCPDYKGDSFDTICAYGKNGAIIHYSATAESDTSLSPQASLLVDSGGQYEGGTTDVTRVFVLGDVTEEFKVHYTTVCKSMLRLQNAVFKEGVHCAVLDMLARESMWKMGLDYRHGTGHGIGYMLSVHEGPCSINYANTDPVLRAGMVVSDEPGYYADGKYGIRIENELICKEMFSSEYGDFLGFEPLTVCPVDLDAINVDLLDRSDIKALNDYHKFVYNSLAPFASEDELSWLKEYTKDI